MEMQEKMKLKLIFRIVVIKKKLCEGFAFLLKIEQKFT